MQNLAVDKAGNVWDTSDPANPRFVSGPQANPRSQIFSLPPSAEEARKESRAEEDQRLQREAAARAAKAADRSADAANRQAGASERTANNQQYDNVMKLRSAYESTPIVKEYRVGIQSLGAALKRSEDGTGDTSLIYDYAKAMDPGSVVRESEMGMAAGGGSSIESAAATLKKQFGIEGGGNLSPAVRERLKREIANKVATMNVAYSAQRVRFAEDAKRQGFDPAEITGNHDGDAFMPAIKAAEAQQKADNELPGQDNGAAAKPPSPGEIQAVNGGTKSTYDPEVSGLLDSMINAGAGAATINAALSKRGFQPVRPDELKAAQAWMKSNPGKKYYGGNATRTEDLSLGQKVLNNEYVAPVAAGLASYFNTAAAGLPQALAGEEGRGNLKAAEALNPNASMTGSVLGGVTGALGAEAAIASRAPAALARYAPRIADALYGGALGFNTAKEGEGLEGAAKGAVSGAVGGFLGDRAMRAAGGALRGVTSPAVGYLQGRNIPLTAGQVLGGGVKKVEDALTSLPFVGNMVDARRMEGLREFNRAAFDNAAVNATGGTITDTGAQGLQQLRGLVSQRYGDALGNASIDVANDPSLIPGMTMAAMGARNIPQVGDDAANALEFRIGEGVAPDGTMSGRDFQEAYRGLARDGRGAANGAYANEFAGAMREGQDVLASALEQQNPGAFNAFREANSTNRNANVLAEALNKAKNAEDELFTPAQLNMADSQSARRLTGPLASAAGERPFYDLANAGQQVLPSKLPDSGTWTRALVGGGATGVLGGTGYATGGAEGAGAGTASGLGLTLALAAGGSRPAQRAIVSALTRRPDAFRVAGDRLIANGRVGGWTGAGALAPLFVGN